MLHIACLSPPEVMAQRSLAPLPGTSPPKDEHLRWGGASSHPRPPHGHNPPSLDLKHPRLPKPTASLFFHSLYIYYSYIINYIILYPYDFFLSLLLLHVYSFLLISHVFGVCEALPAPCLVCFSTLKASCSRCSASSLGTAALRLRGADALRPAMSRFELRCVR